MIFVILGAVVTVSATAIAWYYKDKTSEETKKQKQLEDEIRKIDYEYTSTVNRYKRLEKEQKIHYVYSLRDELIRNVESQRKEKEQIKLDLENLEQSMRELLKRPDTSPYLRNGIKREFVRLEEAFKRVDAYYKYLNWFKQKVEYYSNRIDFEGLKSLGTPDTQLPDSWLYEGKLILLDNKEELEKKNEYGQKIKLSGVRIGNEFRDDLERKYFETKISDIPLLIVKEKVMDGQGYSTLFYGSVLKGEIFYNHIFNNMPLEVKPFKERLNNSKNVYLYKDAIECYMKPQDKKFPLKLYSRDEEIIVYIKEFDLLLKEIYVSEKPPEIDENSQTRIYIACSSEEILKKVGEGYLYLSDYNPVENKITFRLNNYSLICSIKGDYLKVEEIKEEEIKSPINIELPFQFYLDLDFVIEENKNLILNGKESIAKLINFIEQEINYMNNLLNGEKTEYELFQDWLYFIDYQINKNEISYKDLFYDKKESQGEVLYIHIEKSEENLKKFLEIEQEAKQLAQKSRDVKVAFEIRFSKSERFTVSPIGTVKDIDLENNIIKVDLDDHLPEHVEFSPDNRVYIGIYQTPTAYIRQKKALINFQRGDMVNPDLKRMLINPQLITKTVDPYEEKAFDNYIKWQNPDLTENQKEVIKKAFLEKNIFLIQGPPGTGKTTVIKELVHQFLKQNPDKKVLIVSQQNVAVDNALTRIYKSNKEDWFDTGLKTIVRVAVDTGRVDEDIQPFVVENWFKDYKTKLVDNYRKILLEDNKLQEYMQAWFNIINKDSITDLDREVADVLLASHSIVGATCVGFANKKFGLDRSVFDLVIIDEAARATLPELLIPILRAKKVVLIGDHYQLPPAISKVMVDDSEDIDQITRKLAEKSFFEILFEKIPETNKAMLTDQFRMPKEVGNMISKFFYNGKLKNGIEKSTEEFIDPVVIRWIDVKGKSQKDKTSRYNLQEVEKIKDLLIYINSKVKHGKTKEVAVITPYSSQKKYLNKMIEELTQSKKVDNLIIKCDTVDSFQGQEADIVIYSCVRTEGNISFLIDEKRLNVALSRVRENLFIVGHKEYLYNAKSEDKENLFKLIIDYIENL